MHLLVVVEYVFLIHTTRVTGIVDWSHSYWMDSYLKWINVGIVIKLSCWLGTEKTPKHLKLPMLLATIIALQYDFTKELNGLIAA